MNEYISKQRAKDLMGCCLASTKAEYKVAKDEFTKARFGDYISAIQSMIDVVDSVEAADVQPIHHGRWIECCNELDKTCSCCNKVHGTIYEREPFCPNCGARMDLKDGDTNE